MPRYLFYFYQQRWMERQAAAHHSVTRYLGRRLTGREAAYICPVSIATASPGPEWNRHRLSTTCTTSQLLRGRVAHVSKYKKSDGRGRSKAAFRGEPPTFLCSRLFFSLSLPLSSISRRYSVKRAAGPCDCCLRCASRLTQPP